MEGHASHPLKDLAACSYKSTTNSRYSMEWLSSINVSSRILHL